MKMMSSHMKFAKIATSAFSTSFDSRCSTAWRKP